MSTAPMSCAFLHDQTRTQSDPDGHAQMLFFGYANCPGICSSAMPMLADITDKMAERGVALRRAMITVDPARDTVAEIVTPLVQIHADFIGLTGSETALQKAYASFSIEHELAYENPEYGAVYAHVSVIYLLDRSGDVLPLIPPVMDTGIATEIAWKYLAPESYDRPALLCEILTRRRLGLLLARQDTGRGLQVNCSLINRSSRPCPGSNKIRCSMLGSDVISTLTTSL